MFRIKIKNLARELGVTSRVVIDRCRELGLPAQNSIAKLDSRQAQQVRTLLANQTGDTGGGPDMRSDVPDCP